jgi:hypothetical protein
MTIAVLTRRRWLTAASRPKSLLSHFTHKNLQTKYITMCIYISVYKSHELNNPLNVVFTGVLSSHPSSWTAPVLQDMPQLSSLPTMPVGLNLPLLVMRLQRLTYVISGLKNNIYEERLREPDLQTLSERRHQANMAMVHKILQADLTTLPGLRERRTDREQQEAQQISTT